LKIKLLRKKDIPPTPFKGGGEEEYIPPTPFKGGDEEDDIQAFPLRRGKTNVVRRGMFEGRRAHAPDPTRMSLGCGKDEK